MITIRNQPAAGMLRAVLILIGFTAVIAQIVLMRELIVVFYGNEISLGLMLAGWLLWTAIGSSLFGRLALQVREPRKLMAGLQATISLAFPAAILAVRISRGILQSVPGEALGPGAMLLTTMAALSLFCAVSGWLFAAGSRLYASEMASTTAGATGSVYLYEAAGSGIGGILASLILIRWLTPFEIASAVGFLNLLAATCLILRPRARHRIVLGILAAIPVCSVLHIGSRQLESISLARLWQGFHLVANRNSIYGNLAIVETEGSSSVYENGLVIFNVPDPAAAEEAVHLALLQHPSPESLLLVGGGINGSLAQALQHPSLQRVDYVELDPTILDLAQRYFPKEWHPIQADRRVRLHTTDGRLFLKTTGSTFDVIIVNLPDPQTAQLNRFYTLEFFREAAQRLTPTGIFSFRLTGSENYISAELAEFLQCINKTLRQVFPQVVTIPGDTVHFFAAARTGVPVSDPDGLLSRLRMRGIKPMYVREYYIPFRMMADRMRDLESQILPQSETPLNRDFAPIAYYFDVALWSTQFNRDYRRIFESIAQPKFGIAMGSVAAVLLGLVLVAWRLPRKQQRLRTGAGFSVAAMGFTLIGLEMLLLLGFQAIYGYVYHQLAIVIAGFMVGMALGSWWGLRSQAQQEAGAVERREIRSLFFLQLLAALSPLLLYMLFVHMAGIRSTAGLFIVSQIVFPLLALLCGLLGGYQFPLASRIYFTRPGNSSGKASNPGTIYALDLVGACLGAVAFSTYLVPVFGFLKTALLVAVINFPAAALIGLAIPRKTGDRHERP